MEFEVKREKRKKNIKGLIGKILKNKIGRIVCLVLVVVIVLAVVLVCSYKSEQTLDTTYIIAKLEKSSELTTAKLNFTGMSEFNDSGISFISKSDFIMVYEATARAGIDVKNIKVVADDINHVVWLTLPKAEILDVKVDMNKIKYFDEKFSLFNVDAKEDANKANALAEEEAKKELAEMGILEMANDQAEALIKGLIQDVVPKDYEIKIKK
ncbi:MAG: DUF4230 domain-containing protein [Clostridia bacterium]|nr:DUF4230 domain-containing protein [Clostridia bacterium]